MKADLGIKTNLEFNVMETIELIYLFSEGSRLKPTLFNQLNKELSLLSDYLELTPLQSLLFANGLLQSFSENSWHPVFEHFDLEKYEFLKYENDIEVLYDRKLFRKANYRNPARRVFDVNEAVLEFIKQNKTLDLPKTVCFSLIDVLGKLDNLNANRSDGVMNEFMFEMDFDNLLDQYSNFPFIQWMCTLQLEIFEKYYLMNSIWDCLKRNSNDYVTDLNEVVSRYFESKANGFRVSQSIIEGDSKLIEKDLIELGGGDFNYLSSKLTDLVVDFLKEKEGITIRNKLKKNINLITADSLIEKQLFYNPIEEASIKLISNMLAPNEFEELQERLKAKDFPIGVCTLLFGEPGTGKTESVYQLAKSSGRNIYKVDISQTKSMWFGESQKLIKDVFNQYKKLVKNEKKCPILLFNEADGIISKRKAVNSSNVASTENAIQNILLEEMETFEGILFATTNLIENIDVAFERRFLFKVKFEKTTVELTARIWQNKLNFLSHAEAISLANTFCFSGGEIENVARKCLIEEILLNKKLTIKEVKEACLQEKWSVQNEIHEIGFKRSTN